MNKELLKGWSAQNHSFGDPSYIFETKNKNLPDVNCVFAECGFGSDGKGGAVFSFKGSAQIHKQGNPWPEDLTFSNLKSVIIYPSDDSAELERVKAKMNSWPR